MLSLHSVQLFTEALGTFSEEGSSGSRATESTPLNSETTVSFSSISGVLLTVKQTSFNWFLVSSSTLNLWKK